MELIKFITLLVINVTALIGNSLMVIVAFRSKTLRKFQNAFIFNMAMADVLQSVFIMPSALVNIAYERPTLTHGWCQLFAVMKVAITLASVYSLAGVSIQRYFFVVKRTRRMNNPRSATLGISFVWVISILFSITPFVGWGELGYEDGKEVCTALFHVTASHTMVVFTTALFLNIGIMVFCYCCIFLTLHKSHVKRLRNALPIITSMSNICQNSNISLNEAVKSTNRMSWIYKFYSIKRQKQLRLKTHSFNNMAAENNDAIEISTPDISQSDVTSSTSQLQNSIITSSSSNLHTNEIEIKIEEVDDKDEEAKNVSNNSDSYHVTKFTDKELHLLKTIVIVVAVFIGCWTPYVLFNIFRVFNLVGNDNTADTVTMWLGFFNTAVNPFLYGGLNKQFRHEMLDIFKCLDRKSVV